MARPVLEQRPAAGTPHPARPEALRCAVALVALVLALAVQWEFLPREPGFGFLALYPCTILVFQYCGIWPARVVALVGAAACYAVSAPPLSSPHFDIRGEIAAGLFLLSAWLTGRVLESRPVARVAARDLSSTQQAPTDTQPGRDEWVFRFKSNGTLLYVNDAFCEAFGHSAATLLGSPWHPLVPADDIPVIERQLATLRPEAPVLTLECRIYRPDGSITWGHFVGRGVFDASGRLTEVHGSGHEVTDLKQLEVKLATTARELTDLYDNAPCGYHSLDGEGRILRLNRCALDWIGLDRNEVVGKRRISDFMTPRSRTKFLINYPTFLATGHMRGVEYEFVSATGVKRRIRVTANALRDAQGNFLMTRSVLHDITELAQARRELASLNAEQQAMLDNELIGIVKTRGRQIRWANKGMHRLFGYAEGRLVGQPVRVLHGDERSYELAGRRLAAALERDSCLRMRFDLVGQDGRALHVDATGSRVPGDGGDHLWIFSETTDGSQQTPVHQGVLDVPGSGG